MHQNRLSAFISQLFCDLLIQSKTIIIIFLLFKHIYSKELIPIELYYLQYCSTIKALYDLNCVESANENKRNLK